MVSPDALTGSFFSKIHYGYVRVARIAELAYDWTGVRPAGCPTDKVTVGGTWSPPTADIVPRGVEHVIECARAPMVRGEQVAEHVHVAVVGYGYWGSKHVRVLAAMPDVAVTVVDSDVGRLREAEAHYPRWSRRPSGSTRNWTGSTRCWWPRHRRATSTSRCAPLTAGKHVLVEKPLATSVKDAEALVSAAAADDLVVGHTFEYNAAVRQLRDIIRFRGARPRALHRLGPAQPPPAGAT